MREGVNLKPSKKISDVLILSKREGVKQDAKISLFLYFLYKNVRARSCINVSECGGGRGSK